MNSSFDWNLVPTFLAVLQHGSVLAASKALQMSQPTAGRQIALLEQQLGTALFERQGRGMAPTAAARRLADAAEAMKHGAEQLAQSAASAQIDARGTVRISASEPVACVLLPPVIAALQRALPDVQIELVASNAISNLLRREADIALRMVAPTEATLVARRIAHIGVSVCASTAYLREHGAPQAPEDLFSHRLIGDDTRMEILRGFGQWGQPVAREHFCLRTDSMIAHWQAVRAGVGIGFVADYVIATDPQVCPLLPQLNLPPLPLWLVVHREIRSSRRIRAVYDFLAKAVPDELQRLLSKI